MVNILANITRKCTSRIREQLPTPIHLHQHIKTTILLTSSCSYTHNITFLILLLKKKGRTSQKMATLQPSMFLLLITNMSFITGQFSTKGKEVHIIPSYKKGDKLECSNCRATSLLPNSKIIEKAMYTRLYKFLEKYSSVYKKQFH